MADNYELMIHKFKVGEPVLFQQSVQRPVAPGLYEILRQLPPVPAGPQYLVKSKLESCERNALESELSRAEP